VKREKRELNEGKREGEMMKWKKNLRKKKES